MSRLALRGFAAIVLSTGVSLPLPTQYFGQSPGVLTLYQLPLISLAQPPEGGSVPQDRPVVVFRFSAAEPSDPLDARSFAVSVDGENHTSLFQMTAVEAWGPIAPATKPLAIGPHQLVARICSFRGACSSTSATVSVGVAGPMSDDADGKNNSRTRQFLDALLGALRALIKN